MVKIFKNLKNNKLNRGMTYVELIVVLSIFSVMTSVVLFNYGGFQSKVDVRNLASDMALKVVEAQKSAVGGKLPPAAQLALVSTTWKPSYGVYIDRITDNKSFVYFTDIDNDGIYEDDCTGSAGDCIEKLSLTKGNYISGLQVFYIGGTNNSLNDFTAAFVRPNSGALLRGTPAFTVGQTVAYVEITVSTAKSVTAKIRVYPSGRIQIN